MAASKSDAEKAIEVKQAEEERRIAEKADAEKAQARKRAESEQAAAKRQADESKKQAEFQKAAAEGGHELDPKPVYTEASRPSPTLDKATLPSAGEMGATGSAAVEKPLPKGIKEEDIDVKWVAAFVGGDASAEAKAVATLERVGPLAVNGIVYAAQDGRIEAQKPIRSRDELLERPLR